MRRVLALVLVVAAGCADARYAVVDGKRVERPSVAYGSDDYRLAHERAYPGVFDRRRGLDVSDGTLHGRVCNVDLDFDASWYGARLHLDGHGTEAGTGTRSYTKTAGDIQLEFEVTELAPGRRHIFGRVPVSNPLESPILDLDVAPDRIVGRIGMRRFDLKAAGDYLAGRIERHGDVPRAVDEPYAIYGRRLLETMVAADEAVVLLMMMTCSSTIELDGKQVRGFSLVSSPPNG